MFGSIATGLAASDARDCSVPIPRAFSRFLSLGILVNTLLSESGIGELMKFSMSGLNVNVPLPSPSIESGCRLSLSGCLPRSGRPD